MIPFFHKIRKKMADDNRPLKYMRYAIGEILLVVVGILIALYINNWNEGRIERRIEFLYFERLSDDLEVDIKYYDKRIRQAENTINDLSTFVSQLYEFQQGIDEILELFSHLDLRTDPFTTANSTFQELLSTGDFRTIKNDSLKKIIIEYYRINDDFKNQMEEYNAVSTNLLVENFAINPNIMKTYFMIYSSSVSSPLIEGEFDYINEPKSHKFQILRETALVYLSRNQEHLEILKQMKLNAERVSLQIENEYNLSNR
jgi:hypothetical protein